MRADTQSVTIEAGYRRVFDFLADPANLPRWAVMFARDIRREGDRWVVQTPQAELPIRYVTDAALGVIDYYLTVAPGVEAVAPSRVVPNGEGAEYIFTQFQAPDMPDEVFEGQRAALAHDLNHLRAVLAA